MTFVQDATWLILGASSPLARAFVAELTQETCQVILAGRTEATLREIASQVGSSCSSARTVTFDMRDPTSFGDVVAACAETDGPINVAVFLGGQPTQAEVDADPALIAETITDNAVAAMTLLHGLVPLLRARGAGTIIGIGSVVGDRGRRKNYVYGAGKAAFHTYLSGLRSAFVGTGLHVMTVKPGYIQRPGQPAPGPKWLVTEPEPVARKILQAAKSQRNVVYVPGYWRGIMYAVRSLPEALFKRTKF